MPAFAVALGMKVISINVPKARSAPGRWPKTYPPLKVFAELKRGPRVVKLD